MNDTILAFDIGTSSLKASLFSSAMELIAEASSPLSTRVDGPGMAMQDPLEWWSAALSAARVLRDKAPEGYPRVGAIGVSGHMLGLVSVDRSLEPVFPALIHSDTRAAKQAEAVRSAVGKEELYRRTGNILSAASPLAKALWLKDEQPEAYAGTYLFLQSKDYLVARLTGSARFTDLSDAAHAQFLDIEKCCVLDGVLRSVGLSPSLFPEPVPGTHLAGPLSPAAASLLGIPDGVPVCVGAGDGSCASAGAGNLRKGDSYLCLGTTGWIATAFEKPVFDDRCRLFTLPSVDGRLFNLTGTVQCVGRSFEWAKRLFSLPDMTALNELAGQSRPGSNGVVFLPYLEGERCPWYDENARGVFYGLRPDHEPRDLARAVFEGVACAFCDVIGCMGAFMPLASLRVIGGGAASRLFADTLASMSGVRLDMGVVSPGAVTSLGAAAAASVCAGMYGRIEDVPVENGIASSVLPKDDPAAALDRTLKKYRLLYPALAQVFSDGA